MKVQDSLFIDIHDETPYLHLEAGTEKLSEQHPLPLSLSSCQNNPLAPRPTPRGIPLFSLDQVEQIINRLARRTSTLTVVLGGDIDPFFPIEARFDISLRMIELIANSLAPRFIIRTRSPLVLLAAPILAAQSARAAVCIAIEALDDETNFCLGLNQPRPSERLKAAKALAARGISTEIQLAPLAKASCVTSALAEFARELSQIYCSTSIVNLQTVAHKHLGKLDFPANIRALELKEISVEGHQEEPRQAA